MKYEDMTWLEINHAIAEILEPNATQIQESRFNAFENDNSVEIFVDDDIVEYDFSKPSDAWPIIQRIFNTLNEVASVVDFDYIGVRSVRMTIWKLYMKQYKCDEMKAAMICFLKMKDAESNAN